VKLPSYNTVTEVTTTEVDQGSFVFKAKIKTSAHRKSEVSMYLKEHYFVPEASPSNGTDIVGHLVPAPK